MKKFKLMSSDGIIYDCDEQIAKYSGRIKSLLEESELEDEGVIPLPHVNSVILSKILIWAEHHKNDEQPLENRSPWDVEFLQLDTETIIDLAVAAEILKMKELSEMARKTIGDKMKGLSLKELRDYFYEFKAAFEKER